ncbi:MAG: dihydrolipoyl dehydrogenase [Bdellovibrionales bacterium]
MKGISAKIFVLSALVIGVLIFRSYDLGQYLTLETLKEKQQLLENVFLENPIQIVGLYFLIYVAATAFSVPGATILTLAGGLIFGFWWGTLIVSFASTIGATLAFLGSRYLLRDTVRAKFGDKLRSFDDGVRKDGVFYLFTLRLVPVFPFFLINLVMGLTPISTLNFFWVSQLGMLAGTAAFVNAGTQLSQITSLKGILSPSLLISFAIIGFLPLISKIIVNYFKQQKALRKYKKPNKFDYNLVVIGGGSAGLVSSYIAAAVKAKVALIEKHKMGGDCLNTGCVPSKALIRSAKMLSYINRAKEFGFKSAHADFDFKDVMERVQRVITKIEPHDSISRYSGLGVECITGAAKIVDPYRVEVNGKVLTTKSIIVATGAGPLVPPIQGLNDVGYLTSDTVWNLRELPKRLVVLGGGPIGCELAQCFQRFGSQVTIVEMLPQLLIREDDDVSQIVTEKFKKEGIQVLTSHKAKSFHRSDDQKYILLEKEGREVKVEFDAVLLALGRKPNVKGFGLEELNIEISSRGTIAHDPFLRTNVPNIFVCGDVAGPYQFTHTAAHQAWFASVNALFGIFKKFKVDYRVIPWCTFTDPEVARVGLNEKEATEKKIDYQIVKYGIDDLDRAIADEEDHGFVKVLTPKNSDKILGVTIVGSHAGDIIAEYVAAMKHGFGMNKILSTIHIYPTLSEANKYAAGIWKKANAPAHLLRFVEKLHAWRRS